MSVKADINLFQGFEQYQNKMWEYNVYCVRCSVEIMYEFSL